MTYKRKISDREKVRIAYPEISDEDYQDFNRRYLELCKVCDTDFVCVSEMIHYLMKMNISGYDAMLAGEAVRDALIAINLKYD